MHAPDVTPSAPNRRLFVAVDAPPAVCEFLGALATQAAGLRWTPAETLHLTLRFVGETDDRATTNLTGHLRAIVCTAFVLTIGGVGVFPTHGKPQVLWAGVGSGHPRLHQLRQRVDDAILATGLSPDMRSFHPHFTLARCASARPGAVRDFLHRHATLEGPSFLVDRFHLFESRLRANGAEHAILETFSLAAG